jgi:hypothetical protein
MVSWTMPSKTASCFAAELILYQFPSSACSTFGSIFPSEIFFNYMGGRFIKNKGENLSFFDTGLRKNVGAPN